jgi:hypothetical protein
MSSSRLRSRRTFVVLGISIPVCAVVAVALTAGSASSTGNIGPDGGPILPDLGTVAPPVPASTALPTVEPPDPVNEPSTSCNSGGDVADRAAAVVRQALEFRVRINVPDGPSAKADLSATDRATLIERGESEVAQLFSGDEVRRELDLVKLANSGTNYDSQIRPLGGGVSEFSCTNAAVSDSAVQIEATATTWSRMAYVDHGILLYAQPSNVLEVKATVAVAPDDTGMTVSYLGFSFAPGSEP